MSTNDETNDTQTSQSQTPTAARPIPKLLPPCQTYSRSKDGLVGREEWLATNEARVLDLWESLTSYLRHTNTNILDRCTYVRFSDFVAENSTHFREYYT